MQDFLSNISDWSLKLCLPVKCFSRKKKVNRDDVYGEADLLLFVHKETANATIVVKLSREVKGACWVTGRCEYLFFCFTCFLLFHCANPGPQCLQAGSMTTSSS